MSLMHSKISSKPAEPLLSAPPARALTFRNQALVGTERLPAVAKERLGALIEHYAETHERYLVVDQQRRESYKLVADAEGHLADLERHQAARGVMTNANSDTNAEHWARRSRVTELKDRRDRIEDKCNRLAEAQNIALGLIEAISAATAAWSALTSSW
ncbi:MAG: hypothetical protein KDJ74_04690 [Notoacmeibacter sp.]|nr:hypothetical protein [Notoacmeibacter sp.]